MGKAIFKFNGGRGALLCSNCSVVIKTGKDFTEQEWAALRGETNVESNYCDSCKDVVVDMDELLTTKNNDVDFLLMNSVIPELKENEEFKHKIMEDLAKKMFDGLNIDGKIG